LVESIPTTRVLLLINYRPEYQHGWGQKTYYTQLRLDPLPRVDAAEMLDALLGADSALDPLKSLLNERAGGNPFFLQECVGTLVETGSVKGERGTYRLARSIGEVKVPDTVQAILAARIDRACPRMTNDYFKPSPLGKDVPFPLLEAISDLPEEALRQGLGNL